MNAIDAFVAEPELSAVPVEADQGRLAPFVAFIAGCVQVTQAQISSDFTA